MQMDKVCMDIIILLLAFITNLIEYVIFPFGERLNQ